MGHRHTTSVDDILFEDGLDFNKVFVVNGKVEKASVVVDVIKVSDVDKDVVEVASVVAAEDVEVVAKLVIVEVEVDDVVAKVVKVICGLVGKFIVVESIVWLDFIVVCGDAEDEVILIGPAVVIITVKKVIIWTWFPPIQHTSCSYHQVLFYGLKIFRLAGNSYNISVYMAQFLGGIISHSA